MISFEPYITFAVVATVGNTGMFPSASDVIVCISFDSWNVIFLADAILLSIFVSLSGKELPPITTLSPLMITFLASISTWKMIFPLLSFTVIAPVLIQSAFNPTAVRILTIVSPSTVIPPFHVCPPSVDTPHASEVIFQIA